MALAEIFANSQSNASGPEAFGDGFGRNLANSQSANKDRQDAISRMSAVQESVRSLR